jgi:7,8-dihydropterin-6-yl-methyl-4-(beta-D-ribofuranosyl)aminobenzene 5'-phosphate synthase
MGKSLNLREADKVEATILVDNYTDVFLPRTEVVKRPALQLNPPKTLLAEHGFSCLLKVYSGLEEHLVLIDTGISATCFFNNVNVLGVDLNKVESVVLSHGHLDHFGALVAFLKVAKKGITLVLHPDAFLERALNTPDSGRQTDFPVLDKAALKETGAVLREARDASTLASDLVLVSGEVERVTDFEKGFPWSEAKIDGQWVVDPFRDDQGVAVKLKGKGLIVIGGCSHAGIINTVKHAQKVAGTEKVHAVLGGFHLTGPIFEPIIEPTIAEMKKIGPNFVIPMHCTGWKAITRFAQEMPEQFLLSDVGATYVFQ